MHIFEEFVVHGSVYFVAFVNRDVARLIVSDHAISVGVVFLASPEETAKLKPHACDAFLMVGSFY